MQSLTTSAPQRSLRKNNFPSKTYISSNKNHYESLGQALIPRKMVHAIEVIVPGPGLPIPEFNMNATQVLLKTAFLQDELSINYIFSNPKTQFISLSPIDVGNGIFIHNCTINIVLNKPTYERFGMTGREDVRNRTHTIQITEANRNILKRMRLTEPIEGILLTEDFSPFEQYIMKSRQIPPQIEPWTQCDFPFDFAKFDTTDNWIPEFNSAIDNIFIGRHKLSVLGNCYRTSIVGAVDTTPVLEWIQSITQNQWAVVMIWDFKDIQSSYVGKKLTAEGFGGGCEVHVVSNSLPYDLRIQHVEFLHSE